VLQGNNLKTLVDTVCDVHVICNNPALAADYKEI
jgi:hypothetical protein